VLVFLNQLILKNNDSIDTRLKGPGVDTFFGVVISIGPIEVIWQKSMTRIFGLFWTISVP